MLRKSWLLLLLLAATYLLFGELEVKACSCGPKLDLILKKTVNGNAVIKTPAVKIQAQNNLDGVELKFPFPGCKKAKLD